MRQAKKCDCCEEKSAMSFAHHHFHLLQLCLKNMVKTSISEIEDLLRTRETRLTAHSSDKKSQRGAHARGPNPETLHLNSTDEGRDQFLFPFPELSSSPISAGLDPVIRNTRVQQYVSLLLR